MKRRRFHQRVSGVLQINDVSTLEFPWQAPAMYCTDPESHFPSDWSNWFIPVHSTIIQLTFKP